MMRLYWEVAQRGFRRYATYRGATLAGVFTNTMFGFIRAYILLAVFAARPSIGTFDAKDALTFVFVTQGMIMVVQIWGWIDIETRVRTGDIALDLLKPYSFLGYWLATDFGRALYQGMSRGIPPILVGAIFFDLSAPSVTMWPAVFVSVVLAILVSFGIRMMINLAAFWLIESRGISGIVYILLWFFSGFLLPLEMFPPGLQWVARALPFGAMINTPVEIYLEKYHGFQLFLALTGQAAWALVVLGMARVMLWRGTRKLVIQGG